MTKFLSGSDILATIKKYVAATEQADFAVAYWGKNAVKLIGLDQGSTKVRVLCDLRSGTCDPREIGKLLRRKNTEVKTRDNLHAKAYLTPKAIVIGSANASRRGLHGKLEFEAAVLLDDKDRILESMKWFEDHWNHQSAECVDRKLLKEITPLWLFKREAATLLGALRQRPQIFKKAPIHFVIFWVPMSRERNDAEYDPMWKRIQEQHIYPPDEVKKYVDENWPFYIDHTTTGWNPKSGEYVVNYWVYANTPKKIELGGVWRVKAIRDGRKKITKQRVVLADAIDDTKKELFGFNFPKREKDELGKRMQRYLSKQPFEKGKHSVIEIPPDELAAP